MSHKFLSHDYDVTILLQTALMLTAMFMKFIPSKKTLSKPLLLYKGPNLALVLKVLISQYFHLSVTERDSPSCYPN